MKRTLIPFVLVLLAGCGGQTSTTPPVEQPNGPTVPETPYTPPDPITDIPDSPYIGDWSWSTSRDGETLFNQGVFSIHSFNNAGWGSGSWAECDPISCPSTPEGYASINVSDDERVIDFSLRSEYQNAAGETESYIRLFGLSAGSGFQRDEQGRLFFEGTGTSTFCVATCIETSVTFIAIHTSTTPTYPPLE